MKKGGHPKNTDDRNDQQAKSATSRRRDPRAAAQKDAARPDQAAQSDPYTRIPRQNARAQDGTNKYPRAGKRTRTIPADHFQRDPRNEVPPDARRMPSQDPRAPYSTQPQDPSATRDQPTQGSQNPRMNPPNPQVMQSRTSNRTSNQNQQIMTKA